MTTRTERLAKVRAVAAEIRADAEADVRKHDGQPIDGRRLGTIHGEMNGLIVGLANCVEQLAADDSVDAQLVDLGQQMRDSQRVTGAPAGVAAAGSIAYTGPGYGVGTVIRHSRKLEHTPLGVVIYNTGNPANIADGGPGLGAQFFIRTDTGWQPCDAAGTITRLADWPDGFASDQIFLPARVWAVER